VELLRIYPDRGTVEVAELASGLELGERAEGDRPYLVLNMIASADGKAALDGRTRGLGSEADHALFHHLRTQVDAVLVGAGTIRIERYGRIVRDPALRDKRRREALAPDPLACVVSGSLRLPPDLPLLQDRESRVLIVTASDAELPEPVAQVEYIRIPEGQFELAPVLERLRVEHGVRSILCEGGPTLNSSLLAEGLVDELFLTLAAKLAGGADALTIVAGLPLARPAELELVWLLAAGSDLFLRYRIPR
jgi:riboflavin-specific deaminase-like protein